MRLVLCALHNVLHSIYNSVAFSEWIDALCMLIRTSRFVVRLGRGFPLSNFGTKWRLYFGKCTLFEGIAAILTVAHCFDVCHPTNGTLVTQV